MARANSVIMAIATIYMITLLALAIQRRPPWRAPLTSAGLAGFVVASLWVVWIATPVSTPASGAVEPPRFAPAHRLLFVSWEGTDLPWLLPALPPARPPRDPGHGLRTGRARRAWATFVPRSLAHRHPGYAAARGPMAVSPPDTLESLGASPRSGTPARYPLADPARCRPQGGARRGGAARAGDPGGRHPSPP